MVRLGIDRINEKDIRSLFENKRLGVISACSGLASDYRYPLDILCDYFDVKAIFSPEHGPRGVLGPGERVGGGVDRLTGKPVYSLFDDFFTSTDKSKTDGAYMPSEASLSGIDCVVFEMQDAGSRYFTYVSTLFYVMRACAGAGLPLVVLDRPNPIGGGVEGCIQDEANTSFIGLTRVPIRHGMTVGELARLYNGEYDLGCDLTVISMTGYSRDMYYDDTGLPFVRPSPNLPTLESLLVYNGTCMFAGTNVSEGRGTTQPFLLVGAEYINPEELAKALNGDKTLEGVKFSPAFFRPEFGKSAGKALYGVRLHVTDKRALMPVRLGVTMIRTIQSLYPGFEFTKPKTPGGRYHIDLSTGNSDLRDGVLSADEIMKKWNGDAEKFKEKRKKYLLY